MKKLITIAFILISVICFSQPTTTNPYLGTPKSLTLIRGWEKVDSGFVLLPRDTTTSPLYIGEQRFRIADSSIYVAISLANVNGNWIKQRGGSGGGGGGNTIYTGDGRFLSNRILDVNGNTFTIVDSLHESGIDKIFIDPGNVLGFGNIGWKSGNYYAALNGQESDGDAILYLHTPNSTATLSAGEPSSESKSYLIIDNNISGGADEGLVTLSPSPASGTPFVLKSSTIGSGNLFELTNGVSNVITVDAASTSTFSGGMVLSTLAGNGVGIASVGNDGSLGWSTGNANLLVDSIGTVGQAIVVPRGDTLYHRLFRAGLYTTVDTASTGEVRSNIDTSASGLHTLITLYGSPTAAAVGASPNANGVTISGGTLTLQPASASFPGLMTTGTQPIAGQKTFSSAFFPTGGIFTNTTAITSNFAANGGGAGTASTNASLAIQGDGTVGDRVLYTGGTAYTMTAAHPYAGVIFGNETEVEFSSGVHSLFARVAMLPNVVNNGSATTTDATTLYIGGPPTGTAVITNIVSSLWVDAGMSRFDGGLQLAYIAKTANYTATSEDYTIDFTTNTDTLTLPTAVGRTGEIYTVKVTANTTGRIVTTSSQTIDGATSYNLTARYKYVTVQSDGANWIVIANNNLMLIVLLILIPTMLFRRKEFEMIA